MLSSYEFSLLQALYDNNRIPLWVFDHSGDLEHCFISGISVKAKEQLATHIKKQFAFLQDTSFDLMCNENELYYAFSMDRQEKSFYLFGGPMLLSDFYHVLEMRSLSFAEGVSATELKAIIEHLPVVSLTSFSSFLRITQLILGEKALSFDEIRNYPFSKLQKSFDRTFIHELFENTETLRLHTPYHHELAVLNCVKEGDAEKLEAIYRTLPQIKYGSMSSQHNPMKQLFYGSIANTTLITRYAIEGGLEEETAFTLSDVYIRQMENCRTLYELNQLNEKMALDFTERVANVHASRKPEYSNAIAHCIDYIIKHTNTKITLETLAKEIHLTPKYLSFLFHKETGITISSFIEDQRIEKAKNLLIYSDYSYTDISNYLCFHSQSHFIFVFKKSTKMTPKEFRVKYSSPIWN